ncbi:hypothetical protein BDN72DRAFT_736336, partial [Pluteus cervinus]
FQSHSYIQYPPEPLKQNLVDRVVTDFCQSTSPENIEEAGCAVCGELHLISSMQPKSNFKNHLKCLEVEGISRVERLKDTSPIKEVEGPIIDHDCNYICSTCRESIYKGKRPKLSLANGLWIGKVPQVLQELTFMEKLLVARIRLNCCYVRVSSGFKKMVSHVISFEAPIARVYN